MSSRWLPTLLKGAIFIIVIAIFAAGWLTAKAALQETTVPRTAAERDIMDSKAAVEANPKSVEARISLAAAYAGVGRYQDAIKELKVAIGLDPKNTRAYYILGAAYKDQGQIDAAIETLKKAGKLKGDFGDVYGNIYYELGAAYRQKEDYKKAIEAYREAQKYDASLYIFRELAECYEKIGMLEDAKIAYLNILQRDISNTDAEKDLKRLGVSEKILEETKKSGLGH